MEGKPHKGISEFAEVIDGVLIEPADVKSIYDGFEKLTPTERKILHERGLLARRAKSQAKKLAELEAWAQAHREVAGEIFEAKLKAFRALVHEGTAEDGSFSPKLLGDKQMKVMLSLAEQMEKAGFRSEPKKTETNNTVNVLAIVADLKKSLGS